MCYNFSPFIDTREKNSLKATDQDALMGMGKKNGGGGRGEGMERTLCINALTALINERCN